MIGTWKGGWVREAADCNMKYSNRKASQYIYVYFGVNKKRLQTNTEKASTLSTRTKYVCNQLTPKRRQHILSTKTKRKIITLNWEDY
jgi:hypothetical protein